MADITYCAYAGCPLKDCDRHLSHIVGKGAFSYADFAPTCRRYIGYLVDTQSRQKDPESCGQSIGFDGMYICEIGHLPCEKFKKCPQKNEEENDEKT